MCVVSLQFFIEMLHHTHVSYFMQFISSLRAVSNGKQFEVIFLENTGFNATSKKLQGVLEEGSTIQNLDSPTYQNKKKVPVSIGPQLILLQS